MVHHLRKQNLNLNQGSSKDLHVTPPSAIIMYPSPVSVVLVASGTATFRPYQSASKVHAEIHTSGMHNIWTEDSLRVSDMDQK